MNRTHKYETWKQPRMGSRAAVHLIVIDVLLRAGEVVLYRIMDLNNILNVREVEPAEFDMLVEKRLLVPWKAGDV